MADNTTLNTGTGGDVIASDDVAGVKFQRVKIALGIDGVFDSDVSATNPLPTQNLIHQIGTTFVHKEGNYSAVQTTTTLWTPASGKKFVISDLTISCGGTTAGVVTIYDAVAATAFSAGTTPSIFRGEFAPTTVSKPGVCKTFPIGYQSTAANNSVLVTSTGITALYIQVNGYEI